MRTYLAARYSRRLELVGYVSRLRHIGYDVQARWLDGSHQIGTDGTPITESGETAVESQSLEAENLRAKFAKDDWEDVTQCEVFIAFSEPPRVMNSSRGGRHVEFGIALALDKRVYLVGPLENIFHWLPQVDSVTDFNDLLLLLEQDRE